MSQLFKWTVVGAFAVALTSAAIAQDKPADTKATEPQRAVAQKIKSVFQKADANNDGKLSAAERQAWVNERFKAMDANGDGKLTPDEFVGQRFVNIDLNKDGTITMEEYLIFFVGEEAVAQADKSAASDKMDANGDGEVTGAEVIAYRKSEFKAIDADGCGKATPDDLKAYNDKKFKSLDANKDGFVTVEEFVAVIAVAAPAKAATPKAEEKKADQPAK